MKSLTRQCREQIDRAGKMQKKLQSGTFDGLDFKGIARIVNARNSLAESLKPHVGTFDHAEMTLLDVARYGCRKLNLAPKRGHEMGALYSFFNGRKNAIGTMDSASNPDSPVNRFISGKPPKPIGNESFIDKFINNRSEES